MRHPPAAAHAGESGRANRPTSCSSSLSLPSLPGFLDSEDPRWTSQTVRAM